MPVWIGDSEMQVAVEHNENGMDISMTYNPAYFLVDPENQEASNEFR